MSFTVELIKTRPIFLRWDVFPFIIFYAMLFQSSHLFSDQVISDIILVLIILANCIVYMMNHWSPFFKRHITFFTIKQIQKNSYVYFTQSKKVIFLPRINPQFMRYVSYLRIRSPIFSFFKINVIPTMHLLKILRKIKALCLKKWITFSLQISLRTRFPPR